MGITEPRNDIEYVQTGQKGIAVAVDTITASSDVPKRMKPYDAARKSVIACVSDFAAKGVRPRSRPGGVGIFSSKNRFLLDCLVQ